MDVIAGIEKVVLSVVLAFVTVITFANVLVRKLSDSQFAWTEELVINLFILMIMNVASAWHLPVIFVNEMNCWASTTPYRTTCNTENISDRAVGYHGVPSGMPRAGCGVLPRGREGGLQEQGGRDRQL